MISRIVRMVDAAHRHGCGITLPTVAAVLARHAGRLRSLVQPHLEFAVHGYSHCDHSQLGLEQQVAQLKRARELFATRGLRASGFRSPYLRLGSDTLAAVREVGFLYDSSEGIAWDVVGDRATEAYRTGLEFYRAVPASQRPSLPRLEHGLVRIPYCLPDDEALSHRLGGSDAGLEEIWPRMLREIHGLGELFTLCLHPERIGRWGPALDRTLSEARSLSPPVWFATHEEIATWWRSRAEVALELVARESGEWEARVRGAGALTLLVRGAEVLSPSSPWDGSDRRVHGSRCVVRSSARPVVGVSPESPPALDQFLREQGFPVARCPEADCAVYVHRPQFSSDDGRSLLARLGAFEGPLVRLSPWPDGAKSALSLTGDVDALTLWDYAARLIGR